MGGSSRVDTDLPCNLVLVHGTGTTGCHGHIESHRDEAIARGFNVGQRQSPALVPLLVDMAGYQSWVRLDSLGGLEFIPSEEALEYLESIGVDAAKEQL